MKNLKITLLSVATLLLSFQMATAQHTCATDEMNNHALNGNPAAKARVEALEKFTADFTKQNLGNKSQSVIKVIPVVFHVLHLGGIENISDAQIFDAMDYINRDYNKQNPDTTLVVPSFSGNIANVEFEFRLATIDPNGNCTNGITRHYDQRTYWDRSAQNNYGYNNYVYTWDPTKYLNIYVVSTISGNAAAYTYKPGTWPTGSNRDAIVSLNDYVGGIGTSSPNNARTLTHEIGHWFNLSHPWGSTNEPGVACGDDLVGDTPETMGSNLTCNLSMSVCNPPIIENVQNYMDYSYCSRMFTNGQATRMQAAANASTNGRNNLWTANNLAATGTTGGPPVTCAPIAAIVPVKQFVCAGGSLSFKSLSYNAPVTAYSWSFPGGTPATDTAANPTITYNTPGTYDVSLTVSNGVGSSSVTYTQLVKVIAAVGTTAVPFSEGFETMTFPGADWDSLNNGGSGWAITTAAHYSGAKSIKLNNYAGNPLGNDDFITAPYNFTGVSNPTANFRLAFASKVSAAADNLKVYVSGDCGKSWVIRYNKTGTSLVTAGVVTSSFTPTLTTQWRQENLLSINNFANLPNVRFRFSFDYAGTGNNVYIDDININGTVGIDDIEAGITNLYLYPNPSNGETNLNFTLERNATTSLRIMDVAGRMVEQKQLNVLTAGEHNFIIGQNLNSGIYIVQLLVGEKQLVQKLIIN